MSNFVLTLQLKTEKYQEDILNKKFEECRKIYNSCISELYKRYNHMRESKQYKKICKLPKGKDRNIQFTELDKKYNLTEYSLHNYVKSMSKYFNIDAMTGQTLATRSFNAFQKLMFHQAKKINYIKFNELVSIEGKSNRQGIRYRNGFLFYSKLSIPVIIRKDDIYAQESLNNKIKYCRIKREIIKGKYHYYVQLIIEGVPPIKITKQGEVKGQIGNGKVGIDIGIQTIAYSSQYEVKLLELAPEINSMDKQIKLLQRKMERSRRAVNPNKFNKNGTINISNKKKWVYSNNYLKTKNQYKEIYRRQKEIRRQSHNKLANQIITLGNEFYVEDMNYKGLQAKSKKTEKNDKGRFKKKKRFGKSLNNKAPAMLLTILNNKLKWNNIQLFKIDTYKVKASQYNHFTNKYVKKELNERWNDFNINGQKYKIQRDLYSAFLIMNVRDNLKEIDRDLCFKTFNNFNLLHNKEIQRIINSKNKRLSSMGI